MKSRVRKVKMNESLKKRMNEEHFSLVSIDLFAGPGGLCTGFKWAGTLPLIAVEWTDTTVETYSQSHDAEVFELSKYLADGDNNKYIEGFNKESTKTLLIHGDINLVSSKMIKDMLFCRYGIDSVNDTIDVVSGGAPCESFSIAGTRTANDDRDDLFSNILRISRTVRSKMILFENVKGILSKSKDGIKGAIFEYICNSFEDNSVNTIYKLVSRHPNEILLRACDYGVPQLRERIFLVAIRSDLQDIKFAYPSKEYGCDTINPYVNSQEAIEDLPIVYMGEETTEYNKPKKFISDNQRRYVSIMRGEYEDDKMHAKVPKHLIEKKLFNKKLISVHKGPGHIKRKQELLALIQENESMRSTFNRLTKEGKIDRYRQLFPNTIYGSRNRRLVKAEPSFTVTSHCLDEIIHHTLNRAITPREAARLQSFPDWYQFSGPYVQFHGDKVQDKYEQIGDAIPPLLAYAIGIQIVDCLPKHI